jgi:hypothetical protein
MILGASRLFLAYLPAISQTYDSALEYFSLLSLFLDVTPCRWVYVYHRFGGAACLPSA